MQHNGTKTPHCAVVALLSLVRFINISCFLEEGKVVPFIEGGFMSCLGEIASSKSGPLFGDSIMLS